MGVVPGHPHCSKSPSHILAPGQGGLFRQREGPPSVTFYCHPCLLGYVHKNGHNGFPVNSEAWRVFPSVLCLPCDPRII